MNRVAILGCGYLGLALAETIAPAGTTVVGLRRTPPKPSETDIEWIAGDLRDERRLQQIPAVDAVVFCPTPDSRGAAAARRLHLTGVGTAIQHFGSRNRSPTQFCYVSSTSVLGDHEGEWVDESTSPRPPTDKASVLYRTERTVCELAPRYGIDPLVVRLAGLYGPDRYRIERTVSGPVTTGYRNRIHRDDAAAAIAHLLRSDSDTLVHLVDDEPLDRVEFARWLATELDRSSPAILDVDAYIAERGLSDQGAARLRSNKRIRNDRLLATGFDYRYPTAFEGYRAALDADR